MGIEAVIKYQCKIRIKYQIKYQIMISNNVASIQ